MLATLNTGVQRYTNSHSLFYLTRVPSVDDIPQKHAIIKIILDCQVSDWGQWSECNASCGTGIMTRTRKILQSPQNGGKHCPTLMQKRGCQGYRCHGHHDKKILRGSRVNTNSNNNSNLKCNTIATLTVKQQQ
ncbi:hypothetical protein GQX74_008108 [Glossina fuscipes]|nr:hypothetical protein GQX74_008108 [Glossina fuscipes]